MALAGDPRELYLAGAVVALPAAAPQGLRLGGRGGTAWAAPAALLGLAVFMQFKSGFVRHDQHAFGFFAPVLFVPFLLPAAFPSPLWRAPVRVVLLAYAVLLSAAGMESVLKHQGIAYSYNPATLFGAGAAGLGQNLKKAVRPGGLRRRLEAERARLAAANALPRIKEQVGNAAVDLFTQGQGLVFVNGLTWRPRPAFQSYYAYTPELLAANARFYQGPDAPEYVLFMLPGSDGRLPLEDGAAVVQLLRRYRPVLVEKGVLLLRRLAGEPPAPAGPPPARREQVIRLGEEVGLDDGGPPERMAFAIDYTWRGRLWKALFKPPPLFIRVKTSDGRDLDCRLIPGTARAGLLFNPLLLDTRDLAQAYGPAAPRRVVSLRIHADPEAARCYRPAIRMTRESLPEWRAPRTDPAVLGRLLYPNFESRPLEVQSTQQVRLEEYQGRDVLMVHADGRMTFPVPPGARSVRGQFGILPIAYERGKTDGVQFAVEYQPDGGPARVLFERYLDPLHNPQDRGFQNLAVALPGPGGGRVRLKTLNLPGKTLDWDWSFWTSIRIK
jgi:hypothetical protein